MPEKLTAGEKNRKAETTIQQKNNLALFQIKYLHTTRTG